MAGIVLGDLRIGSGREDEPEFMVLVDSQTIRFATLDIAQIGVIERMVERVLVVLFAPRAQELLASRTKELLDARFAEIELAGPRAPIVQSEVVLGDFPFLGELLPEPAEGA